jgi:predicted ATPase
MKYSKFIIENYKGIKFLELDLNIIPDTKIYTLVGLNESGKTTILEAINDFENEVKDHSRHFLIPKSSAGGFTGTTKIVAMIELSIDDKTKIGNFLKGEDKAIKEVFVEDHMKLTRSYPYKNSTPLKGSRSYDNFIKIKKGKTGKESHPEKELFDKVWGYIKSELFPEIIFYRDFLSKFPEKIYLQPNEDEAKDTEYLSIIEDVLTSINADYTLEDSIINRLNNPDDGQRQALEAVENQLSAKISTVVFKAWSKIQEVSTKEIVVKTEKDLTGRFYIKISVKENLDSYAISERSLGFRWFFTFLLYTEFRKERIQTSGEILFLLDEPASNLHQKAQQSILDTFKSIVSNSRLVFTTHSHHLINPAWLNNTYIIRNKGLNEINQNDFNSTKTEVEAYKYKQFVSTYPTETSYFQPILDVLDYQPGMLELVPKIAITEGKNDFFAINYFKEKVFHDLADYRVYPGHGAGKLDLPIALYESWGSKYITLLDSDKEGLEQKKRYITDLSDKEKIFTLEDVDPSFVNFSMENMFSETDKINITKEFDSSKNQYSKSAFNTGLQILFIENRVPEYLSKETKDNFQKILNFLARKLK